MKVLNQTEMVAISKLTPNPRNPRTVKSEAFERLKQQIKDLGQYKPIIVDKRTGYIIGGHMRAEALKSMGVKEAWVSYIESVDDKEALKYMISDNDAIGIYEKEQVAELAIELGLDPIELKSYALSLGEPTTLDLVVDELGPDEAAEDEEVPEVDEMHEPTSKLGEVYQLGPHRLMCGDSTKQEDVTVLTEGKKVDMVFTDPPYALFGNSTGVAGVVDDKMTRPFFLQIFKRLRDNTKLFGHIYTCCDWHSAFSLQAMAGESGLTAKNLIVWDKGDGGIGGMYQHCYEFVWFHANSPIKTKTSGKMPAGERTINGKSNIWRFARVGQERVHNAQKPVPMMEEAIKNSSEVGESVLDLFGGSGSTLIAADNTGRVCYMMDFDPKYVDVIRKRYQKHVTGSDYGWEEATPAVEVAHAIAA